MDLSYRQLLPIMLTVISMLLIGGQYGTLPTLDSTPAGNPNAGSLHLQLSSTQSTTPLETTTPVTETMESLMDREPLAEFTDGIIPDEPTLTEEHVTEEPPESEVQQQADAGLGGDQNVTPTYLQQLVLHLHRYQIYPQSAKRRNITGRVTLQLQIDAQGQLLAYHLLTSSGHGVLDKAAENMVKRANPFPRPELSSGQSHLTLAIPILFTLQ